MGQGGGGGFAGAGGSVTLPLGDATRTATIRTSGNFAHGALVQSVGGGGGNGGQATLLAQGGAGAAGGNGGAVMVDAPHASVIATGESGIAVLAQSVGGGGGAGGDTNGVAIGASLAIGGNGGLGGNGSTVRLNLTQGVFASTNALGGAGILAQSIGGSGGSAGSATSTGVGLISLVIGGDAGGGGSGGAVSGTNDALITTDGDHAAGLQAQSIGGGGKGGSATSFLAGILPTTSVAVGGRGGGGGPAGNATIVNTGQIATYGADAHGVLIQSVGGGGGSGGAAVARAVALSPTKEIPAVSISVATGGRGGIGNTGGAVGLDNSGLITTAGDGSIGVMAQSVGGGGGTGGDSTAASYSGAKESGIAISVAVAVGGSGGTGGVAGPVTITNKGLIATLGQDAYGVFAQSVGGGGGTGGAGDATASASEAKFSMATSLAVGGTGGTGGNGGTVSLSNTGAITTRGDGADAVFSQSVGGGGGTAGGGTATASGGNLAIAVGVGGSGGAGGDGNAATVQNSGSIATRGTNAVGMSVQSVGGGGGKAGKAGATAGGVSSLSNAQALFDTMAAGLNFDQKVIDLGDKILQIGQTGENIKASYDELKGIFSQPQAGKPEEGTSIQINVSVAVGGSGGAAGSGGIVTAANTGSIATFGAQSDAIFAQSVGGGGAGGAATSTGAAADDSPAQSAIGVGGKGGAGGLGGPVSVVNGAVGAIVTQGVAAFGIYAQSVGGGGGEGELAGVVSGSLKSLSVSLGGNGGRGGDGGKVTVTNGDGNGGGAITTTGKHGIGIFAQSVGGGGGLVRTMTTDQTFDPAKILENPQGRLADIQGLTLTFGGQNGTLGEGGDVQVTSSSGIATSGLDAHGILAQSIGGGGGMAVGGQVRLPSGGTGGAGGASGDGGTVLVALQPHAGIVTGGDGAYGVLAQSIGGGGGAAGDLSSVKSYQLGTANAVKSSNGNGGAVSVTADTASIQTTGRYAPAIFAQSVGGGGGLVNYDIAGGLAKVQARGTAGGDGNGGAVTVSIVGSRVFADGVGSAGILAQSDGRSSGPIQVKIDASSQVRGGLGDPSFPSGQGEGRRTRRRRHPAVRRHGRQNRQCRPHSNRWITGQQPGDSGRVAARQYHPHQHGHDHR